MTEMVLRKLARTRHALDPLTGAWGLSLLLVLAVALLDPVAAPSVLGDAISSLFATAPVILLAVGFIAWIRAAGAEAGIARAFQGRETRAIVMAAFVGALAPVCSCQVIPLVTALLAVGAPLPAVMGFWLSSPLVDPPTLIITAAALGWPFAIGKAVAAVGLGLAGGFAMRLMMGQGAFANPLRPRPTSGCCKSSAAGGGKPRWRFWTDQAGRATFHATASDNALFLLKWLTLAYLLEALLVRYLPAELVARVVGGEGPFPIVIGGLVGMPAYLNGYVAPPMLAGLIAQGMSEGAAMAFLVAGAVSCVPAMAAVWALVRPPVFVLYVTFGLIGAIVAGMLFGALA